ncbi:hypothetical protein BH11PSE4_BH11PSE4_43230 [soil metagenome]
MRLLVGCVASAVVLVAAATANAQVLLPLRIGGALVTAASDVVGATISTVSDFGGPYAAMPPEEGPRYAPAVLPPREIDAIAREMGFQPLGAPQQRGLFYTVSAIDPDGEDGRLVIDARNGRIMRFMPAYRMVSRMGEEVVTTYGPVGTVRPPDYRRAPRPLVASPKVASRTPAVPLPKAPPRAVAEPKAVAAPATEAPAVQQSAVVLPKTDGVRVIPLSGDVAPAPVAVAPAKTEAMPPVQGLE